MNLSTVDFETIFKSTVDSFKELDNDKEYTLEQVQKTLEENHDIPKGITLSLLMREPDEVLNTEDMRLPRLFVKEVFERSNQKDNLSQVFTDSEIKELNQFLYQHDSGDIELPLELFPALKLNNLTHSVKMSAGMIAKLMSSQILNYSFDIQREPTTRKRGDSLILKPKTNKKNVDEMEELLLKEQLKDSTIYLNAAPSTADEGDELIMDEKNHKLTIAKGTRLDILDGYHRCLASLRACSINPNLNFKFNVVISNYTTKEAQLWQAQHAKAMPWSQHRVKELQQENRGDKVVAALRTSPEIGEVINTSSFIKKGQLVNFTVLSEMIDAAFTINNRREEVEVIELLNKFLDELIQYDIDWERPRANNIILSSNGLYGIIYYLSRNPELSVKQFYSFLDKYITMEEELKKRLKTADLNTSLSQRRREATNKLVEEVSESV